MGGLGVSLCVALVTSSAYANEPDHAPSTRPPSQPRDDAAGSEREQPIPDATLTAPASEGEPPSDPSPTFEDEPPATASTEPAPTFEGGPPADPSPTFKDEPSASADPAPDASAETDAVDITLASGLRVIVAQDTSLPVAAVVLAIDVGSEDDPSHQPGLVHALAYHLFEGNRELAPEAAVSGVTNYGGFSGLGFGDRQVRYESLIPIAHMHEAIRIESQRLRAPTLNEARWKSALTRASRDAPRQRAIARDILSVAHDAPGLAHDGRVVDESLLKLSTTEMGQAMARLFRYERSTLVVVSPLPVSVAFTMVQAWFVDLPATPRAVSTPSPPKSAGTIRIDKTGRSQDILIWPVEGTNEALVRARAWCDAFNHLPRASDEPPRLRVRCRIDDDPRRPALAVHVTGVADPIQILEARFARLTPSSTTMYQQALDVYLSTPLALARQLTTAIETSAEPPRIDDLAGLTPLRRGNLDPSPFAVPPAVHVMSRARSASVP